MEEKTKVIISSEDDIISNLLLSNEQLRLLNHLYSIGCFCSDINFLIAEKEIVFEEV